MGWGPVIGAIGAETDIVGQPRTLLVRGRNEGMGTDAVGWGGVGWSGVEWGGVG